MTPEREAQLRDLATRFEPQYPSEEAVAELLGLVDSLRFQLSASLERERRVREALAKAKRGHHAPCHNALFNDPCTCGADEHNARIDAALKEGTK